MNFFAKSPPLFTPSLLVRLNLFPPLPCEGGRLECNFRNADRPFPFLHTLVHNTTFLPFLHRLLYFANPFPYEVGQHAPLTTKGVKERAGFHLYPYLLLSFPLSTPPTLSLLFLIPSLHVFTIKQTSWVEVIDEAT